MKMFQCKGCDALHESIEILKSEVAHLRDVNKRLSDQLIAATNLQAFNAATFGQFSGADSSKYYGNEFDEIETRDEFGQKSYFKRSDLEDK